MSAFGKWAKGQSNDDLDEDDLDEIEDGEDEDEDGEDDDDLVDGPDPEAIAARLWSGDLSEDEIASMDKELLGQVVDAAAEVEPDMHAAVVGLAEAIAAEDLAQFYVAFKALMEADLQGEGASFDADQCVVLLDLARDRIEKGAKLDTPEGKIALAKLVSAVRSGAEVDGEEEDDELDELDGDDDAADDAILGDFDA